MNLLSSYFSKAHKGLANYSGGINCKYLLNLLRFFYQTFFKDLPYMVFSDCLYTILNSVKPSSKTDINSLIEYTKDRIVIVIPGFLSSTGTIPKIKEGINNRGYGFIPIDTRLTFLNFRVAQISILRQIKKIIEDNGDKQIVLFGYSHGGCLAHALGKKFDIPLVTYSTPLNHSIVSILLNSFGVKTGTLGKIDNSDSFDIVESFSFTNPSPGDRVVADGVFSHFSPNRQKVVDLVLGAIDKQFNKVK